MYFLSVLRAQITTAPLQAVLCVSLEQHCAISNDENKYFGLLSEHKVNILN